MLPALCPWTECHRRSQGPSVSCLACKSSTLRVSAKPSLLCTKKWQSLHARRARHAECAPPCCGSVNDAATAAGDNGGGGTTVIGGSGGLGEPELKFDEQQLDAFSGLEAAMRGYATMSVAASGVAVGKVVLLIVTTGSLKLPPSSVSSLIVHMVTAGIVWKAASLLPRPGSPAARHGAELMQSLRAMAVVFLQIGTMQWFSSAVTMMEAAITWPQLVVVFSAFVALTCLLRVSALGYVFDRYGQQQAAELHVNSFIGGEFGRRFKWLDRAAMMIVGGSLAASQTARGGNQSIDLGGPATPVKRQYEFTPDEETTFSELMDSIRDTGGATMLLCLSHFMHVVAKNFAPGTSLLEQYGSVTAGIEAGAVAGVMLYSVGCFGSILTTSGQDVRLLMKGISADKGLSQLFQRLKNVQTGAVVTAFIPYIIDTGMRLARTVVDVSLGS